MDNAVAKQWKLVEDLDKAAHDAWEKLDRAKAKLVKLAKMGRKSMKVVPISDAKGLQITNKFKERGVMKVFAPAFAKKFEFKEITLDD